MVLKTSVSTLKKDDVIGYTTTCKYYQMVHFTLLKILNQLNGWKRAGRFLANQKSLTSHDVSAKGGPCTICSLM